MLSGKAHISTGDIELNARAGDTFFIPAGQITLGIRGRCSLLITRIIMIFKKVTIDHARKRKEINDGNYG